MGAVAISENDNKLLESLQKILSIRSKSQVIHQALAELEKAVIKKKLALDIKKSVGKCARADLGEHGLLTGSAVNRFSNE